MLKYFNQHVDALFESVVLRQAYYIRLWNLAFFYNSSFSSYRNYHLQTLFFLEIYNYSIALFYMN